jgi:hypothetical protein
LTAQGSRLARVSDATVKSSRNRSIRAPSRGNRNASHPANALSKRGSRAMRTPMHARSIVVLTFPLTQLFACGDDTAPGGSPNASLGDPSAPSAEGEPSAGGPGGAPGMGGLGSDAPTAGPGGEMMPVEAGSGGGHRWRWCAESQQR